MLASNIPPLTVAQERKLKQKLWLEKLKKLEEKEEWLKQHPLIPEYHPRLSEPAPFWLVFFRQKQAFECATGHPQDVHTFAFEPEVQGTKSSPGKGMRKFLVTSYAQLWHSVKALAQMGRHGSFYEVIPEGAACKLYFDLEFKRDLNPEADGGAMVQTLIQFVKHELLSVFGIHCHDSHVINLDASTRSKFSTHLIFSIPGAIFKDNIHAGNFVRHICSKIPHATESQQQVSTTIDASKDSHGSPVTRNIRNCLSPPAKRKKSDADGGGDESNGCHGNRRSDLKERVHRDADDFGNKAELQKLYINVSDGGRELFIDTAVYTRNRNFRLYKCVKLGKDNPLVVAPDNRYQMTPKKKAGRSGGEEYQLFLDSIITNVKYSPNTRILTYNDSEQPNKNPVTKKLALDASSISIEGYQASPFPEIDSYVRAHCISRGGVVGDIRRWTYFSQAQLLVYDIVKNRWCENISRQHRSNNIMILVDLRRGVYYQKCHDPACRMQNFKSNEQCIPPEHLPSFTDWDDEELISLTEQVEQNAKSLVHNQSVSQYDDGCFDMNDTTDEELIKIAENLEENVKDTQELSKNQNSAVTDHLEGRTQGHIESQDNGQVLEANMFPTLEGKSENDVVHQELVCSGLNQHELGNNSKESSNAKQSADKQMEFGTSFDGKSTSSSLSAVTNDDAESKELWDESITDDELLRSFHD